MSDDMETKARELLTQLRRDAMLRQGNPLDTVLRAFAEQRREALIDGANRVRDVTSPLTAHYGLLVASDCLRDMAARLAPAPARDESAAECPQCHEAGWHKLSCSYRTDGGQVRLSATRVEAARDDAGGCGVCGEED